MKWATLLLLCLAAVVDALGGHNQPARDAVDIGSSFVRRHVQLPVKQAPEWIIQLPKGAHASAIADGPTNNDLFVCTLVHSAVYHVNLQTNTTHMVYQDNSTQPLHINGCTYDKQYNSIWASGSVSGTVRVLYLAPAGSGIPSVQRVVDVHLVPGQRCRPMQPCSFLINQIAIGESTVFISDSFKPYLYAVPRDVSQGQAVSVVHVPLGPRFDCAGPCLAPFSEKANGVAVVDSSTLLVSHWGNGNVYKVSLAGLAVSSVAEVQLPVVNMRKLWGDDIKLAGNHTAFMVSNFGNQIIKLQFNSDYTEAQVVCAVQPKSYSTPTYVVLKREMLWTVNTHYLSCVPGVADCSQQPYEVIGINSTLAC